MGPGGAFAPLVAVEVLEPDAQQVGQARHVGRAGLVRAALPAAQPSERNLEHQREALALQREQTALLQKQNERAERIHQRAEQLQIKSAQLVARVRKTLAIMLPVIVILVVYVSWLVFTLK